MTGGGARGVSGELRWNVKQSFRDYVGELPDGSETWTGESGGIVDGDLVFPAVGLVEAAAGDGWALQFEGGVRYRGYRGMLRVDLRDPWIVLGEDGAASITVDTAPSGSAAHRVAIATLQGAPARVPGGWREPCGRSTLTAAGSSLLGDVYPAGTEAADLELRILNT